MLNQFNGTFLDTSMIPLKYSNIVINESTISEPRFFRNPEIVNNIHFIHPMIKNENWILLMNVILKMSEILMT